MKDLKRIFGYTMCVMLLCVGCSNNSVIDSNYQYRTGEYKSMSAMLNKCNGVTFVTSVGYSKYAKIGLRHKTTVIDSEGTAFEYAGAKLELSRLDTVKWGVSVDCVLKTKN